MHPELFRIPAIVFPAYWILVVAIALTAAAMYSARRSGGDPRRAGGIGVLAIALGYFLAKRYNLFPDGDVNVGNIAFPAYFLLLLTGFLFATASGALWARRIGKDPDVVVDLGLACLLMGVVGSRLLHVFADGHFMEYVNVCIDPSKVDWPIEKARCLANDNGVWDAAKSVCHPKNSDCWYWAKFWAGGLTYYGGFIGASAMAVYLLRRDRFPFWKAADMAGFTVPLGLGFGRMGCLLAGCCFGVNHAGALGMSFPPRSPASDAQFKLGEITSAGLWSEPVHPTQIYESAVSLGIAAFCLLYVHGRKRYDGQVFAAFLALYAAGRFVLEFWRADDRGGFLHLSTSQLLGIAMIAVAIAIHVKRSRSVAPPSAPAGGGITPSPEAA